MYCAAFLQRRRILKPEAADNADMVLHFCKTLSEETALFVLKTKLARNLLNMKQQKSQPNHRRKHHEQSEPNEGR